MQLRTSYWRNGKVLSKFLGSCRMSTMKLTPTKAKRSITLIFYASDTTGQNCMTPSVNVILTADPPQEEYETLPGVDDSGDTCRISEHLTKKQRSQLQEVLDEYSDRFSEKIGRTTLIKHEIKLTNDKPIAPKMYRIPESLKDKVHEQIVTMLADGLIEESTSAYASPIVCVVKKDKSIRICADLRSINSITVPDEYPASDMRNILERAAGSKLVTGLD